MLNTDVSGRKVLKVLQKPRQSGGRAARQGHFRHRLFGCSGRSRLERPDGNQATASVNRLSYVGHAVRLVFAETVEGLTIELKGGGVAGHIIVLFAMVIWSCPELGSSR